MSDVSIKPIDDLIIPAFRPKLTLVSTFELLVKPIAPKGSAPVGAEAAARTVVQGYFLTIANTSNSDVRVRLQFTATTITPALNQIIKDTVTVRDVAGNVFEDLTFVSSNKFIYTLGIPAHNTALVTLLPDLNEPSVLNLKDPNFVPDLEIRGYVEIGLLAPGGPEAVNLLLTPEHRGTFLPKNLTSPILDLDQLAYSLPTANGGSLFTLTGPVKRKELKIEVKEIEKIQKDKDFEKDQLEKLPETSQIESLVAPEAAKAATSNGANGSNDLNRLLGHIAQRLDEIEQRTAGQSFIQPQERPSVGQQVVNQPRNQA